MSRTDPDPLGDGFKWRLRAELNRSQPRYSSPRYLSPARRRIGTWRFAPAGLAAGVAGMLVLTAYAATGSPNPVVWTQQIVTRIGPNVTESSPTPQPESEPSPRVGAPGAPTSDRDAEPTSRPQAAETPQPGESPEPGESPQPAPGVGSGPPIDR